jgi:hypothetical protein
MADKSELKLEVTKAITHRKDAAGAERKILYKKPLRALRLCGETNKNDRIP